MTNISCEVGVSIGSSTQKDEFQEPIDDEERVFTFIVGKREVYRGNVLLTLVHLSLPYHTAPN